MKTVDAATMRQIDLQAQETFGIPEILLMESAGRGVAEVLFETIKGRKGTVAFFCGKGNNGGDGFVAARVLFLQEVPVILFFTGDARALKNSALVNFQILKRLQCPIHETGRGEKIRKEISKISPLAIGVDALLGIGLQGEVREPYREMIEEVNRLSCPIVAVDIPSGLCATTGKILGCCVKAQRTVTFGLPKKGFYLGEGPSVTGEIIVKNIGYPKALLS